MILLLGSLAPAGTTADDGPAELQFAVIADIPSTGLAVRLLSAAYRDLGIDLTTRKVPSRRALMMADIGAVDGDLFRIGRVGDLFPNLIQVPYPLMEGRVDVVTKDPEARQLPETSGRKLRVAVRRGIIVAEQTAEELGMVPILADSYSQMRAMLDWGRVDLALVSSIEGLSPLDDSQWDHLTILPEPAARFTLYHYLHRRHGDLVEPLAEALKRLEHSGEKTRITEQVQRKEDVAASSPVDDQ